MRLYLIENTLLANLTPTPVAGDTVAYFRDGLDPDGSKADTWRKQGVNVVFAEGLLDRSEEIAIDDWVNDFLGAWWRAGPEPKDDFSRSGDFSLGFLGAHLFVGYVQPGMTVRAGQIFQRLLDTYAAASEIVTDIRDGHYPLTKMAPSSMPRRTLLTALAGERSIVDLDTLDLPILMFPSVAHSGLPDLIRAWLGGFRPDYLIPRLRTSLKGKTSKRIYFFLNHALSKVASKTSQDKGLQILCDQKHIKGTLPLRHDHLLPLPDLGLLMRALGLWRRVEAHMDNNTFAQFDGFDYGPFLKPAIKSYCGMPQIIAAIRATQVRKMLRFVRPDSVVLNADTVVASRAVIALQPTMGYRVINIEHGLNSEPYGYWTIGSNYPNITVIVPGAAHMDMWGRFQPENEKPHRVILPTQVAAQMTHVRGKRRTPPGLKGGRVMILNYSPRWNQTNRRTKKMDRYTLDVLAAAKILIDRGVEVSLRPQLTFNMAYFKRMLQLTGLEDKVTFDRTPDFANALLDYDVIVTNLTTCYYQSLYAGWPTIFYEPGFDRRDFVGLLGDEDIHPPHAQTPTELVSHIEDALTGRGPAAHFAHTFNEKHLEQFLGPEPDLAEKQLSNFLVESTISSRAQPE